MRIKKAIAELVSTFTGLLILVLPALTLAVSPSESGANATQISCEFKPWLSCSDKASGRLLWRNTDYTDPSPFTIFNDRLFISHSTSTTSFDLASGETVWQTSNANQAQYFYPVLIDDSVYLASTDGRLEKYQARSGRLIWSRSLSQGWVYPPLIIHDQLITGGQDRRIWILDPDNGSTVDSIPLDQELVAPLFQAGDTFIASTFDSQLQAYQLSPDTGHADKIWSTRLGAPAFSHVRDTNKIVTADMGGYLSSIDVRNGTISWHQKVHDNALYWNALYKQNLISLTDSGVLSILDISTGQLRHSLHLDGEYNQPPVVSDESIAVYDRSGALRLVEIQLLHAQPDSNLAISN